MQHYAKNPKIIIPTLIIALGIGLLTYRQIALADPSHEEGGVAEIPSNTTTATTIALETATNSGTETLGATSVSWAGEVLSTADVQIYPAREGQIAEWKVRLGDKVRKGQVLGRLTAPPASLDATVALAERSQALVRARAQSTATEKLVREGRTRLAALQGALAQSRDAALAVAEKEALKNIQSSRGAAQELSSTESNRVAAIQSAEADLTQAEASLPLKRQAARAAFERLAEGFIAELTSNAATGSQIDSYFLYNGNGRKFGSLDASALNTYLGGIKSLQSALRDKNALPEEAAKNYIQSAKTLLANTMSSDEIPSSKLSALRTIITDDEKDWLEALKEYKEAQTNVAVTKADLNKITAEQNRTVVSAKTNSLNAEITVQSTASIKQQMIAEALVEFAREKGELDTKVGEFDRELSLAQAEVRGAEAAYDTIAAGVAGQTIIAAQAGTISAIFKNMGDRVTPETAIGGISSASAHGRFVRFRIPSDMRTPSAGEEVQIERPGFPLTPVKAKIIGVGLALDQQGSFSADAEFVTPTDWPVHASVRVVGTQSNQIVLVPLTAIWWNEQGVAQVWLVTENNVIRPQEVKVGRAVGDRIQIEAGLEVGSRFVIKTTPELKTGQSVSELSAKTSKPAVAEPEGDGHGHAHDE